MSEFHSFLWPNDISSYIYTVLFIHSCVAQGHLAVVLICVSLTISDAEHLFMLMAHSDICCGEMSTMPLAPFVTRFLYFCHCVVCRTDA